MNILITGGAGFIGSHILQRFSKENCQITVLDNLHSGNKANIPENVNFIEMDICDKRIIDVFERNKFEAVVHLAAQTMVNASIDDPIYDSDNNIRGTINILEACRKTGVRRIVFSSTAAVYGDVSAVPVLEDFNTDPLSFYGLSKLTVEKYLKLYQKLYGLEYVILRYANVYGERQGDGGEGGVISIFMKLLAQNKALTIHGDGKQSRDFVYAGEIANANWLALNTENINEIYNISTQTETSINELVETLETIAGKKFAITYGAPRQGDILRSVLSNDKAREKIGYKVETSLAEGLRRTYQYFVK